METSTFNELISRLFAYYRREKQPDKETRQMWYKAVKHIPEYALSYIESVIQSERESLPINLPKAIKDGWIEYINRHPQDRENIEKTPCRECNGIGLIWGWHQPPGCNVRYTYPFRCAKCENWKRHISETSVLVKKIPLVTVEDLGMMGYHHVDVTYRPRRQQQGE